MRFLIDNALSPIVAKAFVDAGHAADHVRARGLAAASDTVIFELAEAERRILVSADTDFATLLALRQAALPSVILVRLMSPRRPETLARLLLESMDDWREALEQGALVTVHEGRARVRSLPILRRS